MNGISFGYRFIPRVVVASQYRHIRLDSSASYSLKRIQQAAISFDRDPQVQTKREFPTLTTTRAMVLRYTG